MDDDDSGKLAAGLYLAGTPIGNMEDVTLRLLRVLSRCDVLACEDTRVTRKLFQRHDLPSPSLIVSCRGHNERGAAGRLAALARSGKAVAYCSDAGMPGVSDPGSILAGAARAAGARLEVVPGPSAVTAALAVSGVPCSSFTFLGFPPRRDGRLVRMMEEERERPHALVWYESPRRLARLLRLAAGTLGGGRSAAVCLELTKRFERVESGSLEELAARFAAGETRGEAVVVVAGRDRRKEDDDPDDPPEVP